jgi:hypothetical protein
MANVKKTEGKDNVPFVPTEEVHHEIGGIAPHILTTSALNGDEWLVSRHRYFTPEELASGSLWRKE